MYRNLFVVVSISLWALFSAAQLSTAQASVQTLQKQLEDMYSLQGSFVQEVYDNEQLLQEATGTFYLQRPARLRWVTDEPDASVLVADGETIWFYNPFIEQVTLYTQAEAMQANPLLLLLDSEANWEDFEVTKVTSEQDIALATEGMSYWQINQLNDFGSSLTLGFADQELKQLMVNDGQGQMSIFYLHIEAMNEAIDSETFSFKVSPGTDVDDQRE